MGINIFPATSVSLTGLQTLSNSVTCISPLVSYVSTGTFTAGIYTVTCVNTSVARVEFWSGTTLLVTAVTVSGTVTVSIASTAIRLETWTDTGSNVVVNVQNTGLTLASAGNLSGTIDTLTTSGNYSTATTNGYYYAVTVGGGGGGAGGTGGGGNASNGGASGGVGSGVIAFSNSGITYTIGAGGNGGTLGGANTSNANAGGTTTFGTISATGGGKGNCAGNGITDNGPGLPGGASANTNTISSGPVYPQVGNAYNTSRGAGGNTGATSAGNIGTGGIRNNTGVGGSATGYGAGGGSTADGTLAGGAGTAGVIYVLRSWTP
jgi:hypothetical protein